MSHYRFLNLKGRYNLILFYLLLPTILISCFRSDYEKLVRQELGKNIRKDSVILGIALGDSKQKFQEDCRLLNKSRILALGAKGGVQFMVIDSTTFKEPQTIQVLLLPGFDANQNISDLTLEFAYENWAAWNTEYNANVLQNWVLKYFEGGWGGNSFLKIEDGETPFYVKVDGNRRAIVKVFDGRHVNVLIHDMTNEKFK